ncbi:hypothetical protein BV898_01263 [Hypsibius exemplaris]|uniref:Uncharacterized protein n=1 Tax=Hypsibius exemplaris TaxID=2072580 RepID=A0A1W0XC28_HYPEX|nr:hypothetical protein BV898_01263 [Hypsibius exemplaris]
MEKKSPNNVPYYEQLRPLPFMASKPRPESTPLPQASSPAGNLVQVRMGTETFKPDGDKGEIIGRMVRADPSKSRSAPPSQLLPSPGDIPSREEHQLLMANVEAEKTANEKQQLLAQEELANRESTVPAPPPPLPPGAGSIPIVEEDSALTCEREKKAANGKQLREKMELPKREPAALVQRPKHPPHPPYLTAEMIRERQEAAAKLQQLLYHEIKKLSPVPRTHSPSPEAVTQEEICDRMFARNTVRDIPWYDLPGGEGRASFMAREREKVERVSEELWQRSQPPRPPSPPAHLWRTLEEKYAVIRERETVEWKQYNREKEECRMQGIAPPPHPRRYVRTLEEERALLRERQLAKKVKDGDEVDVEERQSRQRKVLGNTVNAWKEAMSKQKRRPKSPRAAHSSMSSSTQHGLGYLMRLQPPAVSDDGYVYPEWEHQDGARSISKAPPVEGVRESKSANQEEAKMEPGADGVVHDPGKIFNSKVSRWVRAENWPTVASAAREETEKTTAAAITKAAEDGAQRIKKWPDELIEVPSLQSGTAVDSSGGPIRPPEWKPPTCFDELGDQKTCWRPNRAGISEGFKERLRNRYPWMRPGEVRYAAEKIADQEAADKL